MTTSAVITLVMLPIGARVAGSRDHSTASAPASVSSPSRACTPAGSNGPPNDPVSGSPAGAAVAGAVAVAAATGTASNAAAAPCAISLLNNRMFLVPAQDQSCPYGGIMHREGRWIRSARRTLPP